MFFVISLRWDWGVCVSINSVVLFERWINSASKVWVLGNRRLGISLCPGDKREHQVFVSRQLSIFIYRTVQRLGNHFVGKKPMCVVCSGSTWTRSVGFLGMGFLWVSGEIKVLKALRVGVLTILVTSAIMVRGYRFVVLWGCTNLGVIRMEAVTAGRSLNSSSLFFCPFVVHSSDSQTWVVWLIWFHSKPFIVFTLSLLSLYSVLGGVFWGFDCESGDIRGLSSAWVGALTILATSAVMIGGVGFFVLWGCNSPGVIRKQITTVLRTFLSSLSFCLFFIVPCSGNQTWIFWLNRFFLEPFLVFLLSQLSLINRVGKGGLQLGLGLFDDFGVGWFWMLGSNEEVLKYASDEDYVTVDIGWVRRYVKGWVRRLLLGVGAVGYKSCYSFRRGDLVVGQFGPMGWAQMQDVLERKESWKYGSWLPKGAKGKECFLEGLWNGSCIGWSLVVLFSACLVR
ncbi:hypothetical protein HanPI659440_Chr07g0258651 [Helianthus annuus]|nr:hypothetical protein HanPI659440_Chr07g0258651 [Helianthus annuus]